MDDKFNQFDEPWNIDYMPTDIWTSKGKHVCDTHVIHVESEFITDTAFAHRIVQCVNACAGLSEFELERGVLPNTFTNRIAMPAAEKRIAELDSEILELKRRIEILEGGK